MKLCTMKYICLYEIHLALRFLKLVIICSFNLFVIEICVELQIKIKKMSFDSPSVIRYVKVKVDFLLHIN